MLKKYDFQKINISELNADLFIKARTATDLQQFSLLAAWQQLLLNDFHFITNLNAKTNNLQDVLAVVDKQVALNSTDNDILLASVIDGCYNSIYINFLNLYISDISIYNNRYFVLTCCEKLKSKQPIYLMIDILDIMNSLR